MSESSLITFVGEDILLQEERETSELIDKWTTFVDGKDGFLYGIPYGAHRVLKFNPVDKSMEMIGSDLGIHHSHWQCGVLAKNGCIYCPPYYYRDDNSGKMLKINTHDGTVVTFDTDREGGWQSGALGADNCLYFMTWGGNSRIKHILRVDPHTDTLSYFRVPSYWNFEGTVLGKDKCIYGLSGGSNTDSCVIRFDPMEPENFSFCNHCNDDECYEFDTDGVLGIDGYIYSLNSYGQVLKVDTSASTILSPIGERLGGRGSFPQPIIGLDQCIYWPPRGNASAKVLKFDPTTQELTSYAGLHNFKITDGYDWIGGALASDGVIYCAPFYSNRVLAIDPLKELSMTMKQMIILYPDELGRLFVQNNESYSESLFESAVRKFGFARALCVFDECFSCDDEWTDVLVLAASGGKNVGVGDVPLSVIYHLVRRNVHGLLGF